MIGEVWKVIPGHEAYEVSSAGRFRRADIGRPVAVTVSPGNGYGYVRLGRGKDWKNYRAHRLVLLAHVGPPPAGLIARHMDGNRAHNSLTNLVWGSHVENMADKIAHGTSRGARKGSAHHNAKLSEDSIKAIFDMRRKGMLQKDIGRFFGVSASNISRILSSETWQSHEATKRTEARL